MITYETQNISLLKAASTIAVQSGSLMEQIYEVTAERYADHKIHDKCTLLHGSEIPYVLAVTQLRLFKGFADIENYKDTM